MNKKIFDKMIEELEDSSGLYSLWIIIEALIQDSQEFERLLYKAYEEAAQSDEEVIELSRENRRLKENKEKVLNGIRKN